eukprot:12921591-Prorocentrum_lima.AAC.1
MIASHFVPANTVPSSTNGSVTAAQEAPLRSAPLTTWTEEVDTGTGEWDVLPNEEAFYSTTEEEDYHDD